MFCNMCVANNSSILQYWHGMSIEGVLVFYRTIYRVREFVGGGGGLTARRKRNSSLLRPPPPPPFFRSQKGGGVTAGLYGNNNYVLEKGNNLALTKDRIIEFSLLIL